MAHDTSEAMTTRTPIIGLEIHVELSTMSKMFCGCAADHFGKPPNTNTCPVCLGLPGALPVPNKKAVEWGILLGLALNCTINEESKFDRKHYFYPDLPKGFQISQYDKPLCSYGKLPVKTAEGKEKSIRIQRVHIEEDTGKLIHTEVDGRRVALVDLNRCGVPLVEIVTEPDFRTIDEVDQYMKKIQQIVRYLEISSADMEKGTMRIEPSISMADEVTLKKNQLPAYKVELKNINSFRFVRKALEYEINRQTELLESGDTPTQQTRGWNEGKGATIAQREKEEAQDYRYFPEPDIPPMRFTNEVIKKLKDSLPELPDAKLERFVKLYRLSDSDTNIIIDTQHKAHYFEECVKKAKESLEPKKIANWIINKQVDTSRVSPKDLVQQIQNSHTISQISDEELIKLVKEVIAANPKAVEDFKSGKQQVLGYLLGQIMKTSGRIDTNKVRKYFLEEL